jgi:hypothetical protein
VNYLSREHRIYVVPTEDRRPFENPMLRMLNPLGYSG